MTSTQVKEKSNNFHKEIFELTKTLGCVENFNLYFGGLKPYIEIRENLSFTQCKDYLNDLLNNHFLN